MAGLLLSKPSPSRHSPTACHAYTTRSHAAFSVSAAAVAALWQLTMSLIEEQRVDSKLPLAAAEAPRNLATPYLTGLLHCHASQPSTPPSDLLMQRPPAPPPTMIKPGVAPLSQTLSPKPTLDGFNI